MARKNLKLYFAVIIPLSALIALLLWQGENVFSVKVIQQTNSDQPLINNITESFHHPLAVLLMQIFVVLLTAKIMGYLFTFIGQQSVIGEMAAGIILGPSLLGAVAPDVFSFLFPSNSLSNLQLLSQIGLVLFMFIIGMELDMEVLKKKATEALLVSHVSILFPYVLGVALAFYLYANYAPSNISFVTYALFLGIAMSITAFPVLARILKERKLMQSHVGKMSILSAAIGDVTAWCILAIVVSIANAGNGGSAFVTIAVVILYTVFMVTVVSPLLKNMSSRLCKNNQVHPTFMAVVMLVVVASSLITEVIGIHALFGAFLAGVIMPPQLSLRHLLTEKIEDVSILLLLPLFFAFTGLRTQIGLLNDVSLWGICLLIIAVAIAGKFFGSAFAAKLTGQSWKDSLSIGALMNTRGLMEIIVLNIGYDLGILSPEIFTMMVFMALATTCMTGPLLNIINKVFPEA